MNGKDYEVVAFGQHEHQRASRLFESYGNRLSSEPPPTFSCPDFNRLRCVVDGACSTFDVPACMDAACFWSAQSIAMIAANSVGIIPLRNFEIVQAALLRRRPYRRVFFLKTTFENSFSKQSAPCNSELYPRTSNVGLCNS
jgi:hypothetical protein